MNHILQLLMNIAIRFLTPILIVLTIFSCKKNEPAVIEKKTITAFMDTIIQDWEGQKEFIKEYNRLTNSELNIIQPPHPQYMDKLLLSFSRVETPDVCEILPEYLSLFISKDYIVPLNNYINESMYLQDFNPGILSNYSSKNGDIYGFPAKDGGGCVTYIRKDWLDNLNLDIPKTWDEFYNVLYQFTYNDPDKNGIDDTKGYTDIKSSSEDWYNRIIMLDARVEIYFKDGMWVDGFTEPGMINALERLKRINLEELIDPNIINNTTFTARNRFINGNVGVFTYWANHWARNLSERTKTISDEHAEVIPIPPLKDGFYIKRIAPLLVIGKNSKDPEFVFTNFIDKQYDKSEIQQLFTFGVEKYHWDIIDGEMQFLINENDPYKARFTRAFVHPTSILNDWNPPMKNDDLIVSSNNILNKYSVQDKLKLGGSYYSNYYLEIEKELKPEIIGLIINDEISIIDGLALYKKKSAELFISNIIEELNN